MQLPKPTSVDEWRLIWREVGTLLAAKHFISHTPGPSDGPAGGRCGGLQGAAPLPCYVWWADFFSLFEEFRPFQDVYAKLEPYVQASSYVEVKVAWRCNAKQWWWAEVEPAKGACGKVGLFRWSHQGFWLGSRAACGGSFVGCGCRWRWLSGEPPFADGISRPSTPSHHGGECELRHGEGFKEEGRGQGKAHFLGQGWVWSGFELGHPVRDHQ